jgi:hypothetical protein
VAGGLFECHPRQIDAAGFVAEFDAAQRKGPGDGDQPGPNNRVFGGYSQGDAVLEITFAALLGCSAGTFNKSFLWLSRVPALTALR